MCGIQTFNQNAVNKKDTIHVIWILYSKDRMDKSIQLMPQLLFNWNYNGCSGASKCNMSVLSVNMVLL